MRECGAGGTELDKSLAAGQAKVAWRRANDTRACPRPTTHIQFLPNPSALCSLGKVKQRVEAKGVCLQPWLLGILV